MRKKICIGLLAVLLGTGLGAMLVNHIWKEPKQGVDLGTTQMIVKELTVQTLGQVSCSDSVKGKPERIRKRYQDSGFDGRYKKSYKRQTVIYHLQGESGSWKMVFCSELGFISGNE